MRSINKKKSISVACHDTPMLLLQFRKNLKSQEENTGVDSEESKRNTTHT
jgi:hypothetical protein